MRIVAWVVALAVASTAACACKGGGPGTTGSGTGTGTGTDVGTGGDPAACEPLRAHVEELYKAAAARGEGRDKMTDVEVADNVAMVLGDCRAAPGRVASCVRKASSVAQLEGSCLVPLDDEGTEGKGLK